MHLLFKQAQPKIWLCLTPNWTKKNSHHLILVGSLQVADILHMVNYPVTDTLPSHASHSPKVKGRLRKKKQKKNLKGWCTWPNKCLQMKILGPLIRVTMVRQPFCAKNMKNSNFLCGKFSPACHCEIHGSYLQQPLQHRVFRAHLEAEPHSHAEENK